MLQYEKENKLPHILTRDAGGRKRVLKMKRTLSLILALALVFACVLSFASCESFSGEYTDSLGNTWSFKGGKLKIETKMVGETEKLVTVLEGYKYSGDNATVKDKIRDANTYADLMTETAKTAEYTVTHDQSGAFINITKSGVTTKLTLK